MRVDLHGMRDGRKIDRNTSSAFHRHDPPSLQDMFVQVEQVAQ